MTGHRERGSGSLLVVALIIVVLFVASAGLVIAGYQIAGHRARSAADLAALSGATAVTKGQDPCEVARALILRAARTGSARNGTARNGTARNGTVSLARCERIGDQLDFVVSVRVDVTVPLLLPGLPRSVSAVGHAGPVS